MKKIALLLLFTLLGCTNKSKDLQSEKITSEKEDLIKRNDSLQNEINILKENDWFSNDFEGKNFIDKGIENPEIKIESELRKRIELIPLKAVLGGTMFFENIQLLSNKWIIANYSDGHISGRSIFNYKLNEKKEFEFKILASIID